MCPHYKSRYGFLECLSRTIEFSSLLTFFIPFVCVGTANGEKGAIMHSAMQEHFSK
jgi:hypothetical protein